MVSVVLQGLDLTDMLDWAATLTHAVALASGGQYVLEYERQKMAEQMELETALAAINSDMSEDGQNVIMQVSIQ